MLSNHENNVGGLCWVFEMDMSSAHRPHLAPCLASHCDDREAWAENLQAEGLGPESGAGKWLLAQGGP